MALILSSCNFKNPDSNASDPYGIIEAEELGGQPDRLVKCSRNGECPKYAEALFWVAADILSEASTETLEIEGENFGLTDDMSIEEMTEKLGPQLENLFDASPPEYDFSDTKFKRGFMMMERAHNAGSINASNELGLLYMEHDTIKNLALAEVYLKQSLDKGDLISAYNLARLASMQSPKDSRLTLKYLKIASQTKDPYMITIYMLGLGFFGTEDEKRISLHYFEKNEGAIFGLEQEFRTHFGLNLLE